MNMIPGFEVYGILNWA